MEMKEILGKVNEAIAEGLKGIGAVIDAKINPVAEELKTKLSGVEAKQAEIVGEVEKIKALPVSQKGAPAFLKGPAMYKGYKLSRQGVALKNNMKRFETLNSEEAIDTFAKYMIDLSKALTGDVEAKKDLAEFYAKTAMNSTTDAQGGYLVPTEYEFDMIRASYGKSFALDRCKVVEMGSDRMELTAEDGVASVAWSAETSMTESEPTIAQVLLATKDLDGYAIVSNALLRDSGYDVVSMLTEQFSKAIQLELDNQILNGTGSPISGVLTSKAGYSVIMSDGSFADLKGDDLSLMVSKVDEDFAENGVFIMNKDIKHYVRTLKDDKGLYIFQGPSEGRKPTLWEKEIIESPKAPGISSDATSTAFVAFVDLSKIVIGRRVGSMTLAVDPYGLFTSKQTRFRVVTAWALAHGQTKASCRLVTGS